MNVAVAPAVNESPNGPVEDGDVMDCVMDGIGTMAVRVRTFQPAALA